MPEYRIRGIELRNPAHVLACMGALRLVMKAGVDTVRGMFVASSKREVEFILSPVSGAHFVELMQSLSVGGEKDLLKALELPDNGAIGGKETLRPVLLKGKWARDDGAVDVQLLLQGWLEPCSRYGGRCEKKEDDKRKKSPLKFFAGKSTPESVLRPMIEGFRHANEFDPEKILGIRSGGRAQFNFNAASTWNAQRRGFSPHEEGIAREVYPAVEILTAIALDALPIARLNAEGFCYAPWWHPLSAPDAARAFLGHLPEPWVRERYRALIHASGQAKFLTYAELEDER